MSKAKSLNRQGGGNQRATYPQASAWPTNMMLDVTDVKRALKSEGQEASG